MWWRQFPSALRLITKIRFLASLGAGGVIYLTPLVFNQKNFSATQIGTGLALAALIGTISRIISGILLDKGLNCSSLIKWTAFIAILGDLTLLNAEAFSSFLLGELLIGISTGLYWPCIELSVPISCNEFPSSQGFALGRSADALGIGIGASIGSLSAWIGIIRLIYLLDIFWLCLLILLLRNIKLKDNRKLHKEIKGKEIKSSLKNDLRLTRNWLRLLAPILIISLIATAILSLLQSALPIDLVNGGLNRPSLSDAWSSGLIALQLILLVIIQWPVGKWVSNKTLKFGLNFSISSLGIGCLLLGLSSFWDQGSLIILLAQFPLAFGLAAFLPTATEAIIQSTPVYRQGLAMALFSQCFAISAFITPIISGRLLDTQGNGLILWFVFSILCFLSSLFLCRLKTLERKESLTI